MNIIVCDFDDTIYLHHLPRIISDIKINKTIKIINSLRNKNYIFILATGRYFNAINKEIMKYNINFDYLICNNGAEIYDNKYNQLFLKKLNNNIIQILKKDFNNVLFYYDYNKLNIISAAIYKKNNVLNKFKLGKFNDCILDERNDRYKVLPNNVSKLIALEFILKKFKRFNIYIFGDGENDKEMLLKYHGYTFFNKQAKIPNVNYFKNINIKLKEIEDKNEKL
jgi:hydroxymethylpyrimidine pyrophosphatase-like HAD family hydrolase